MVDSIYLASLVVLLLVLFVIGIWAWSFIWSSIVRRSVSVGVDIDEEIADCGSFVQLRCTVTNASRLSCPEISCLIELSDHLRGNDEDHPTFAQFTTHLGPRQQVIAHVRVNAVRRGVGSAIQVHLRLWDGFALRSVRKSASVKARVIIRPAVQYATAVTPQMNDLLGNVRVQRYFNEDPSLLQGIRPYIPGDPMKYVAWMATARTGQLMVKEFGYTTAARCLISLSGDVYARRSRDVFDRLCECALHVMDQLIGQGFEVGLLTNAVNRLTQDFYNVPSATSAHRERIQNQLGALEPIPKFPIAEFLNVIPKYTYGGDMVILITSPLATFDRVALEHLHRRMRGLLVYMVSDSSLESSFSRAIPFYLEHI